MSLKEISNQFLRKQLGIDDAQTIESIYDEFRLSFRRNLENAENALGQSDWNSLATAAHTLKGDCAMVGLTEMNAAAKGLQEQAKARDAARCRAIIDDLNRLFNAH